MLQTYTATLRNGVLDWGKAGPPPLPDGGGVPVHVTLLSAPEVVASAEEDVAATANGPRESGAPLGRGHAELAEHALPGRDG